MKRLFTGLLIGSAAPAFALLAAWALKDDDVFGDGGFR